MSCFSGPWSREDTDETPMTYLLVADTSPQAPDQANDQADFDSPDSYRAAGNHWSERVSVDQSKENTCFLQQTPAQFDGVAEAGETVGCITTPILRIVKGVLAYILDDIIVAALKEDCYGCNVDHPSQLQHRCLCPPDTYYFDNNYDRLVKKLFKPCLMHTLVKALTVFGLNAPPLSKLQGSVETLVCGFKEEPFIRAKLFVIKDTVSGRHSEKACFDAVDFWKIHCFYDKTASVECGSDCVLSTTQGE